MQRYFHDGRDRALRRAMGNILTIAAREPEGREAGLTARAIDGR
ncbi:MAG: hypothetical protein R6V44_12675 [Paracoccaceae bacterium]